MGITSSERYGYIYEGVDEIEKIAERLSDKNNTHRKIKALCLDLWPNVLESKSEKSWIKRTGDFEPKFTWGSPFQIAIGLLDRCCDGDEATTIDSIMKIIPDEKKELCKFLWERYEIFNYGSALNDRELADIIAIYQQCEYILFYAIRRYDDDLVKEFESLSDTLSNIIGVCFQDFLNNEIYLRAYYVYQMWDKIISSDYDDFVNQWIYQHGIIHNMRLMEEFDTLELKKKYREINEKELNIGERLVLALYLLGRRYNFPHKHKELLEMVYRHNSECELTDKKESLIDTFTVRHFLDLCLVEK